MSNMPPPMPPASINVSCPHCRTSLSFSPSQAGAAADCPSCQGKFQIPLPAGHYGSNSAMSDVQTFANKKIIAGICGILLGGLGIHKFVLGFNTAGAIMLAVTVLGGLTVCFLPPLVLGGFAMGIIGLIEGILYITKSDEEFYQAYAVEKREWF